MLGLKVFLGIAVGLPAVVAIVAGPPLWFVTQVVDVQAMQDPLHATLAVVAVGVVWLGLLCGAAAEIAERAG